MVRLPPAEKFSLALRKNVRDEFESKKEGLEKQLSDLLGETWTVDFDPKAIWPYHNNGYAETSLGDCLRSYVEGVIYQIKYMTSEDKFGPELAKEINTIAHAHVLTMDVDDSEPKRFSYCSCDVSEGKLRILFRPDSLGTNIDHACQQDQLFPALNAAAPGDDKPLNFVVRTFIRSNYDPKIAATQAKIGALVEKPDIKLVPNFEDTFAKLEAASKVKGNDVRDDWQENLGEFAIKYFEGLAWQMKNQKFEDDDMLREGFNEGVDKGEITFRIVDSLKYGSYGEVVIEDGVLYIQTPASKWGTNVDYAAEKLLDQL